MNAFERSTRRISNLVQQPRDTSWYRVIRNDAGGPTRIDIYDEIGGSWLFGGVNAADLVAEMTAITGDLEVHINSPGGDVFDGLAIYNSLAQRTGNVTTIVDGLAASAASFIAQAGKTRTMAPGAMMMIHDASAMGFGNASDMRELADLLDKVSDNLASIYASRTGRPAWREAMRAETWYTAQEAVDAGLADRLEERPADEDTLAAVARFDLSVYAHVPERLKTADAPAPKGADAPADGDVSRPVLGVESMPLVDKALPVHNTATVDEAWDGPAAVAAMPNDDEVLRYCHAWESPEAAATPHKDGDDDADDRKSNYKFPHHSTKGGPANLAACRNGLARLDSADIPDGDRAGVKAHLQAHLDDADHDHKDDGDGDEGTHNHAGLPAWLHDTTAPLPAWLHPAKEATQ